MKPIQRYAILIFVILIISACSGTVASQEAAVAPPSEAVEATLPEVVTVVTPAAETAAQAATAAPSATPGPLAQRTQAGTFFAINEVGFGPDGYVSLTNFTDVPVSMDGLYLCQGEDCAALPPAVVQGGETVRVAAGDSQGLENVIATNAAFGDLRPAGGEIALFASADTTDPKALLIYLEWGSTPHALTALAIERGLWLEGSYAPSGPNGIRIYRLEDSGWWVWDWKEP